jgi:hypothetical protein
LYHDLFNGLTLQETTHHQIQIKSMGLTPFEVLHGGNVNMEDTEDTTSSHEFITTRHYHHFPWDEEDFVANVSQNMSPSFSYSFL